MLNNSSAEHENHGMTSRHVCSYHHLLRKIVHQSRIVCTLTKHYCKKHIFSLLYLDWPCHVDVHDAKELLPVDGRGELLRVLGVGDAGVVEQDVQPEYYVVFLNK